jgi:hypothetical protein
LPADGEYLRLEDFFARLELDFFAAELRVLFLAVPRDLLVLDERERDDELFDRLLDFFLAAFFVAMTILLGGQKGTA